MSEENKLVLLEKMGSRGDIIKIKFTQEVPSSRSAAYLAAAVDKCFKNKFYRLIVDMDNIHSPSNDFIATIIEATAKVRRQQGDVKIINLSNEAKQTMAGFNAYSFLSIKSEE